MKGLIYVIFILGFVSIIGMTLLELKDEVIDVHTVQSIEKVENVHGDSDGFSTDVYYIVTTDKGCYKIVMSGFNAHPECAAIKIGETYILTTRGYRCQFLGMYPSIINYKQVE